MKADTPGSYIWVSVISASAIALLAAWVFIMRPGSEMDGLLWFFLWLLPLGLYIDNRSRAFGRVKSPRVASDDDFIISPVVLFVIIIGPTILLALHMLRFEFPPSWERGIWWGSIGICGLILITLLLATIAKVEAGETTLSHIWVPISVGSFILLAGGGDYFGYLSNLVPESVFDLTAVTRLSVTSIFLGALLLAALAEFLHRTFVDRSTFAVMWADWWEAQKGRGVETPEEMNPAAQIAKGALFVSSFIVLLIRMVGKIIVLLIESLARSMASLFDVRRGGLSLIAIFFIVTALLIVRESNGLLELLGSSFTSNVENARLMAAVTVLLAWIGLSIFVHAALGYRNCNGIIFGYVVVVLIGIAAMWFVSLCLHAAVSFGWIDAPGYRFDEHDYFLVGGLIFLLMLVSTSLGRKGLLLFAVAALVAVVWALRLSGHLGAPNASADEPVVANLIVNDGAADEIPPSRDREWVGNEMR